MYITFSMYVKITVKFYSLKDIIGCQKLPTADDSWWKLMKMKFKLESWNLVYIKNPVDFGIHIKFSGLFFFKLSSCQQLVPAGLGKNTKLIWFELSLAKSDINLFFTFSLAKWTITSLKQICIILRLIFVIQQLLIPFVQLLPSSDISSSQLRNKINYNFWTTGHRLKKLKRLNWLESNFPLNCPTFR